MKNKPEIAVLLYNIRSVFNVGSIFRTAEAAGVKKVYLLGITPAPIDRLGKYRKDFSKVSLEAEKYLPWEKTSAKIISKLKKEDYKIFAVEQAKNSIPFDRAGAFSKKQKIALILGNEVKGLPRPILKKADKILEIPMFGRKESLNVAVAFGIIVYSLIF